MKSYDHCEFAHERAAFAKLEMELPSHEALELYPSVYIPDRSRNVYHECDLLVIAKSFAAVVELKHWQGEIGVADNVWWRDSVAIRDPHEVNLPKAKVFKSLLEQLLPATRVPFVQSIVVLTSSRGVVSGAHSAFDVIKRLEERGGSLGDHLTFDGVDEIAKYIRERVKRDTAATRNQLSSQGFKKIKDKLDERFATGPRRQDYADQIPGFKILQEIEHTKRYVCYIAEASPSQAEVLYRLRVFGPASADPAERARQFRSLDTLERLPPHIHIRTVHRHPNERNLVVEVCPWNDVRTLDQVLQSNDRLSEAFVVRVVRDLALALAHVHKGGELIHRNLTPRSVLIGRDDHVELTDFDLAFDAASEYTVLGDNLTEIERRYLAPEALAGLPDFATDIFSLGRLLEELLAFGNASDEIPEQLRDLANKMCSNEPSERPTADDVSLELTEYLGDKVEVPTTTDERVTAREPTVGDTHDTWQLLQELGSGGSSWVFYGESHGFAAALKIFRNEVPRDRCLAERDFLHQVQSPFVAGFYSFTLWAGFYWCIAQEYVEGESLRSLIAQRQRPDAELFIEVTRQMLSALEAMHKCSVPKDDDADPGQSVIHNDVTPGNIVVNERRRVAKLIDFGMASGPGLTVIGGTPGYVARDLVSKDGLWALPEGDIHALAVTLVEWATGERPDSAEAVPALFADEFDMIVAERVADVLRRPLEIGDRRFSDARAMRKALEAALAGQVAAADASPASDSEPVHSDEPSIPSIPPGDASDAETFVEYLNTIHNVTADNRHALAEAQSTSPFFQDLHVELELTKSIEALVAGDDDVVIMLAGHAGDGKSTVAVDLLKRALGLSTGAALQQSPAEVERVEFHGRPIAIIKDMSELSANERLARLQEVMEGEGSAVIVSNTGPLLNTFSEYFRTIEPERNVEQEVLQALSRPLNRGVLGDTNALSDFNGRKQVYIANLSMLPNVDTAVQLLGKLVDHPAWGGCVACRAAANCPIRRNVELLREGREVAFARVRYVYARLDAYGRRMTMRQLSAHLSFSLTAGYNCQDMLTRTESERPALLFSESFFGRYAERTARATDGLFCLRQMADMHFGASSSPQFDQHVHEGKLTELIDLPSSLDTEVHRWQQESRDPVGGEARRRLRRLAYMFGKPRSGDGGVERTLVDDFLHSPMLRTLAGWVANGGVDTGIPKRKFIKKTVGVLMEEYVGAMVPDGARDRMFITLRRPDERVFQSVQIVLKTIPVDEFDLTLDQESALPVLVRGSARLMLTLPLLDYIVGRSRGELTGDLDAIHRASLEAFRGQLLGGQDRDHEVITVLEINADGDVSTHKFSVEGETQRLVYQ